MSLKFVLRDINIFAQKSTSTKYLTKNNSLKPPYNTITSCSTTFTHSQIFTLHSYLKALDFRLDMLFNSDFAWLLKTGTQFKFLKAW